MLGPLITFLLLNDQPIEVEGTLCHPQRLIVTTQDLSEPEIKDCRIVARFDEIGFASIEVPPFSLAALFHRWKAQGHRVYLDRCALPAYTPNDALWPDQWHMSALNLPQAWDLGLGSSGVTVAVIDTGVLVTHPDLAANIWVNAGEVAGNGIDDDLNGYVDDVNGYDFANNDGNPDDVHGHGTACSGLVAGVGNNAIGVSGAAPRAKVMALKAATDAGYFYDTANIGAYLYATQKGARVLSCSFFSDRVSDPERVALEYCVANGTLPVVAAGNSNFVLPYYPAAYECSLSVAALNSILGRASFSNFGSWVDVAAPGVNLSTTSSNGSYTATFSGTSGACPHIAGVAALIMGMAPGLSTVQVRNILEDTAIPTTNSNLGEYTNYGRVDAFAAAQAALSGTWSAKSAVARYMTPYTLSNALQGKQKPTVRIYGRGFQPPRIVRVSQNGRNLPLVEQTRDFVDFLTTGRAGAIQIFVNGTLVKTFASAPDTGTKVPLTEMQQGSTLVTNGFDATLFADGVTRNASTVFNNQTNVYYMALKGTFRRVDRNRPFSLRIKRAYANGTSGTEVWRLYDWSTNSYPYGSFVDVLGGNVSAANTNLLTLTPSNSARFVDDEGTVYLQFDATGLNQNCVLQMDQIDLIQ